MLPSAVEPAILPAGLLKGDSLMAKLCNNLSEGQIIWTSPDHLIVIDRGNYPQAKAMPAGHEPVAQEVAEEVGLMILENELVWQGMIDNPCKREGGTHHYWKVYETNRASGEIKAGSDAKRASVMSWLDFAYIASRTEHFMLKYGISYHQVGDLTRAIFGTDPTGQETDPEWKENPGLEPVWYYIFRDLGRFEWPAPAVPSCSSLPKKKGKG